MNKYLVEAVKEAVPVPAHIKIAAMACASDLLHGPCYVQKPKSGKWEDISEDDWSHIPADLEGEISQVYGGELGNALRDFINEIPTLYTDEDKESVFFSPLDSEEEGIEEDPVFELERKQIVEALFGKVISKEFH
jgi:hypothetical protein